VIPALVLGAVSGYLYARGPSKLQIYRAYAWPNGLSDEHARFHVANHEMKNLKSAMSYFPNVTLQTGADTVTDLSTEGNNQSVSQDSREGAKSTGLSEGLNLDDTSNTPSPALGNEYGDRNLDSQAIFEDGLRMYDEGDRKEAMLRVLEAIKLDPQHIDANLFIATCFSILTLLRMRSIFSWRRKMSWR
jgi:hypothetical protein